MEEIFKTIPGHSDYQVSNLGNVKSLKYGKERILKQVLKWGYLSVRLNSMKSRIHVHQLVAIAFLNHEPNGNKSVIDHINSNKLDNRLENLRIVSNRENLSKLGERKNKTSKFIGVHWDKRNNKWRSRIVINKKTKHLGNFETELEAHEAYQKELSELC